MVRIFDRSTGQAESTLRCRDRLLQRDAPTFWSPPRCSCMNIFLLGADCMCLAIAGTHIWKMTQMMLIADFVHVSVEDYRVRARGIHSLCVGFET